MRGSSAPAPYVQPYRYSSPYQIERGLKQNNWFLREVIEKEKKALGLAVRRQDTRRRCTALRCRLAAPEPKVEKRRADRTE